MENPHSEPAHHFNPSGKHQSHARPQQQALHNPSHGPAHSLPYFSAAPPPLEWQHYYAQQLMAAGYPPPYAAQSPMTPEMIAQLANAQQAFSQQANNAHYQPQGQTAQPASDSSGNDGLKAILNDIGKATGLGKLSELLSLDDREFWKGAIVGASIAMLASNKNLHALMGMASNLMATMNPEEQTDQQTSNPAEAATTAPHPENPA